MKITTALLVTAALLLAACSSGGMSMQTHAAQPKPDPVWLASAVAAYPLTTCVVSDDKLGEKGDENVDYVWHQDGQPDRLVRFCCSSCRTKFEKEPAKYLKLIDEAAAAKAKG
jgi:ABC-type glycerol-3-phosphate transport system substrate-binding protein